MGYFPAEEMSILRILIVGGAGYIGSHTARAARRHGFDALLYDNLSTGHEFLTDGFELIPGDIADKKALTSAMRGIDAVIHFAAHAYVGESVENPRKYFENNVAGALALLNTAIDTGVQNFVFSSSCAVYGVPPKMPITEDTYPRPVNPYGVSKLFFENALEAYERAYGLRFASLRYFNAAGADENGETGELHDPETHLIPLALAAASGHGPELRVLGVDYPTPDGTCIRDYVHVVDLAEAHVLALKQLVSVRKSLTVNLGTGIGHSVKQIIAAVEKVTGRNVPWHPAARRAGDPPILVADPTRAQETLGWRAVRSLHEIILSAWNWLQLVKTREMRF